MNKFEEALINFLGQENLEKVQKQKIGIAGAGGLGSNCAFNLVRSGFKKFCIVDFDKIEFSNLDRQFYFYNQVGRYKVEALKENLIAINPDIDIEIRTDKIEEDNIKGLFEECDIIAEAFDNPLYKKVIVEAFMNSNKFLVSASGLAGIGNSDEIKVNKIKENFYIVGDLKTGVAKGIPPISPRVNVTAAKQADIILDYVIRK